MIQRAFIQPLKGKYYGTIIVISTNNNENCLHEIKIWDQSCLIPSVRELNKYNITEKQWVENSLVDYEDHEGSGQFKVTKMPAREVYEISDCHFESKETYELALEIVKKLNS